MVIPIISHIAAFYARQDITAKNYGDPSKGPPSNGEEEAYVSSG
jgi:hypothetical protein